jgi:hypothetical protein
MNELLFFFCIQLINNYQTIVEKDFIYYNIITIKWGESTHFPGRNDPGRTGNQGETTRIRISMNTKVSCKLYLTWRNSKSMEI